jgi:hypothetical protein
MYSNVFVGIFFLLLHKLQLQRQDSRHDYSVTKGHPDVTVSLVTFQAVSVTARQVSPDVTRQLLVHNHNHQNYTKK